MAEQEASINNSVPAAAPAAGAAELLTEADIESLYDVDMKYNPDNTVLPKLERAIPSLSRSHYINSIDYPTVYFTSDIHADVKKLIQTTRAIGLASMPDPIIDPYTPVDESPNLYDTAAIISDVTWTGGSNVLFVIVGDLVDGKRSENSIDDPIGSCEMLLLCYLYNLRLRAREQHSEVLFTIGNHDYCTVVSNLDCLQGYIHDSAFEFYGDSDTRRVALRPFYKLNPFFILSFMNESGHGEMACVHGGLHAYTEDYQITNHTDALDIFQYQIDRGEAQIDELPAELGTGGIRRAGVDDLRTGGPLWTRFYEQTEDRPDGVCDLFGEQTYPFIVVGHCTTNNTHRSRQLIIRNPRLYTGCSLGYLNGDGQEIGVGCVVTDCNGAHGPRLAFVDTAMSKGFRQAVANDERDNQSRFIQFLRVSHTEPPTERYYNRIESVKSDTPNTVRVLYSVGGAAGRVAPRRRSRRRKRSSSRKRKETRRQPQ
jgi:hypothetical protein